MTAHQAMTDKRPDLAALNEPQREAVTWPGGPLLILAGAGSGKTRVITQRIAWLLENGVPPWSILAVTFTNRAAREMRERVFHLAADRAQGVWVSTFHSFCAQFLRTEGTFFGLDRGFAIYDDDDQKKVLKECLAELNLAEKKFNLGQMAGRISREKDQLMDAESYAIAAAVSGDPSRETFSAIYSLYQRKLQRAMALDFGDLILKTVELLRAHDALRQKYQTRFQHVLVDEYQDTNHAQYHLTKILAAGHKNLCVVGDDDQSIYSWRGADIRNILEFESDYGGVKVVKLEQNYRSTQPILDAAWKVVQNNQRRKEKKLWTERASNHGVEFKLCDSEQHEAGWIADMIYDQQRREGRPYNHYAVFYRTNAQSRVLEDALRRGQIPYVIVGSVRFYERAEVKDAMAYLKLIANPKDDVSLKRVLNFPPRGIGKTSLEALERVASEKQLPLFEALSLPETVEHLTPKARESVRQFRAMVEDWILKRDHLTVFQLLKLVLERTRILELMKLEAETDPEAAGRLDNVQELMNAAEEFEEKSADKSTGAYLEQVALITDLDMVEERKNGVTLMTVHISKGLEFPCVFLTGLEEGLFPLGEAQFDQDGLEEERRIAYVGMTRAKDRLYLTSAATRRLYGQTHWNQPSRFISEAGIDTGVKALRAEPDPEYKEYKAREDQEWSAPKLAPGEEVEPSGGPVKNFRVGQRVRHPQFGAGKITQCGGSDEDLKVTVQFDNGQWKKLLVKYAPLQTES